MSVNKVILVGRIGSEIEIKDFNGNPKVSFSLATSKKWKKEGVPQEKTTWHNIVVWGKLGSIVHSFGQKGRQVYIEGEIDNYKWTGKDGVEKRGSNINASNVTFLGSKGDTPQGVHAPQVDPNYKRPDHASSKPVDDDDIPF